MHILGHDWDLQSALSAFYMLKGITTSPKSKESSSVPIKLSGGHKQHLSVDSYVSSKCSHQREFLSEDDFGSKFI